MGLIGLIISGHDDGRHLEPFPHPRSGIELDLGKGHASPLLAPKRILIPFKFPGWRSERGEEELYFVIEEQWLAQVRQKRTAVGVH
jgi:hypothetical protein